jgi:hypothetical protein
VQDGSGAIVLRLAAGAGGLGRGELVEVTGVRSTKAGMQTIYVTDPPARLGTQAEPAVARVTTAGLVEPREASLVVVRGAIAGSVLTSSAGNVYFDLDDGSGPARVYISPRSGITTSTLATGAWLEVTGVLLQETTGDEPNAGYRLWPRVSADVRVLATPPPGTSETDGGAAAGSGAGSGTSTGAGTSGGNGAGAAAAGGAPAYSGDEPPLLTIPRATGSAMPEQATGPEAAPSVPTGSPDIAAILLIVGSLALALAAFIWATPGIIGRVTAAVGVGSRAETGGIGQEAEWEVPVEVEPEQMAEEDSTLNERRILPPT